MTVMMIGAHPDDEISAGGTLLKHSRAGDRVVIITMTRGGMGHRTMPTGELEALREKEAHAAAKALGAELRLLDYKDGQVPASRDVAIELARHIREVRPDIVITHGDETLHPDHHATHRAALDAVFHASLPLLDLGAEAHNVPRVLLFSRNAFQRHDAYVDITDAIEDKIAAAACHASQYTDWLTAGGSAVDVDWSRDFREVLRQHGRALGGHCGVEYAEAFMDHRAPAPKALDKLTV